MNSLLEARVPGLGDKDRAFTFTECGTWHMLCPLNLSLTFQGNYALEFKFSKFIDKQSFQKLLDVGQCAVTDKVQ